MRPLHSKPPFQLLSRLPWAPQYQMSNQPQHHRQNRLTHCSPMSMLVAVATLGKPRTKTPRTNHRAMQDCVRLWLHPLTPDYGLAPARYSLSFSETGFMSPSWTSLLFRGNHGFEDSLEWSSTSWMPLIWSLVNSRVFLSMCFLSRRNCGSIPSKREWASTSSKCLAHNHLPRSIPWQFLFLSKSIQEEASWNLCSTWLRL